MEFTIIQNGTRRRLQAPAGAIAVGGTYHVVGTYDGAVQRLYINGAQAAQAALTGAITANTNALYIGSWNGTSELFRGTIDEVAVYSTVLSATQVSNHYNVGTTVTAALVHNAPGVRLVAAAGRARDENITPVSSAFDGALHRLYVAGTLGHGLTARNGVTVFDTRSWRVVRRINTGGSGAPSIAVDPARHLVYVTSAVFEPTVVHGSVKVIDGRTGRIVRTVATGPGPKAVAVMAIDGGRVVAAIPIGPYERYYDNAFGLAVDEATNTVYASNPLDGSVYAIDGDSNAVARSLGIGGEPTALAVNARSGRVYVTTRRQIVVIDGTTGAVVRRRSLRSRPRGIAVDAARGVVYATAANGDVVTIAPGATRLVAHSVTPSGVTVDRTGRIAVADAYLRSVLLLDRGGGPTST
jgi:DNA-binding beta-propeller fold protein YncE